MAMTLGERLERIGWSARKREDAFQGSPDDVEVMVAHLLGSASSKVDLILSQIGEGESRLAAANMCQSLAADFVLAATFLERLGS